MLSQTNLDPYLIETESGQVKKFSKTEAEKEAILLQQSGENVEVHHRGMLQYRLSGLYQGNLFS
jgi:hypothetical protein|tara:strand:+ start:217 stop:408 length:192 start_codon:yes stop_codon:yes gene_type:complete